MPRISLFYGILIVMNFGEPEAHQPHFHARYAGQWASFAIDPLKCLAGKLPARAERMLLEWAAAHQKELMESWRRVMRREFPTSIPPLA